MSSDSLGLEAEGDKDTAAIHGRDVSKRYLYV